MTKKDYELIAGTLADLMADFSNSGSDEVSLSLVCEELSETLAKENPRFNRSTFLKACGVSN